MFIRARVEFANHEDAVLIPLSALAKRDGREGVFLADPNGLQASFVPITTGILVGETVEVVEPRISGLVVTIGNHLLEDGSKIILPSKTAPAAQSPSQTAPEGRGTPR